MLNGNNLKIKLDGSRFKRLFFCGDIHGYHRQLMKKLDKIGFNKKEDALICTGDLVDRGDESIKCLELLDEDWFISTAGNHDLAMWSAHFSTDRYETKYFWRDFWNHRSFGSQWFFDLPNVEQKKLADKIAKIGNLPLFIELDRVINGKSYRFGITHADIFSYDWDNIPTDKVRHYDFTQSRDKLKLVKDGDDDYSKQIENVDFLVTGHSIVKKPSKIKNHYFIDTGAYEKRGITIIEDKIFAESLMSPECNFFKEVESAQ